MWTEEKLNDALTCPSPALVEEFKQLHGDILVVGAGGKMGPSLCVLASRAIAQAGAKSKVKAVSRFSDAASRKYLEDNGVECISADLLDPQQVKGLPDADNIMYMAGKKFGTQGAEHMTWAMNTIVPARVAERYLGSRVVVFSSGNIYPMTKVAHGGATEVTAPAPIGEYAMSCLGRERVFDFYAREHGLECFFYRLNYALDLRYGVLHDIAKTILDGQPVSLSPTAFNCIWQRDANEIALRGLFHCAAPPAIFNVTGPETGSLKTTAIRLAALLGKDVAFTGEEQPDALLNNAGKSFSVFGYPTVPLDTLITWQAQWIQGGGSSLGKPTHFEEREGQF